MLFRKKNISENLPSTFDRNVRVGLRRRFHHFLLKKQKGGNAPKTLLRRPKRILKPLKMNRTGVIRKIFPFLMVCILAFGLFYLTLFSKFFTVTKITLEKNGDAVTSTSLAPFLDKLKGKNILFLSTESLTKELEQTFRNEILLVRIKKSYPNNLIVKVEEYPAVLNLKVIAPDATQKFVLNQIGYTIFENREEKNLPFLTVKLTKGFKGKTIVIERKKLEPVLEAFRRFTELFGIKVTEGEWKKVERELHLKTEKNFTLWLYLGSPINEQLSKLKRALPKLDIYHEPLEYIDLRIPGGENEKVIYKKRR